jgi:vacuolar-type H+-ATPase subunit D/Vma8
MTAGTQAPSRAARLRLLAQANLARHATDLLHNKEEALRREQVRLAAHATRTAAAWIQEFQIAADCLLRARLLGGSAEVSAITPSKVATVTPQWKTAMGVTYPGTVNCEPIEPPPLTSTAALSPTAAAYRSALLAAAEHAAAGTALARLDHELAQTRQRRRAIEEHLVPNLTAAIHELDGKLDEQDREEAVRIRLALQQRNQNK